MRCDLNFDVNKLSHMRTVGRVGKVFFPRDGEEVRQAYIYAKENGLQPYPLGNGSNTLIGYLEKIVLISDRRLQNEIRICDTGNGKLTISAGININLLIMQALQNCLGGLEFLAGIPANLGGLICMNAGANGRTISEFVEWVDVVNEDGEKRLFNVRNDNEDVSIVSDEIRNVADDSRSVADDTRSVADDIRNVADDTRSVADDTCSVADDTRTVSDDNKNIVLNQGIHTVASGSLLYTPGQHFQNVGDESGYDAIKFGYRCSNVDGFIIRACLKLKRVDREEHRREILRAIADRKAKQPLGMPNLGCFFKNHPTTIYEESNKIKNPPTPLYKGGNMNGKGGDMSAGYLIDQAGLKSFRIGGAMVSPLHANFLVNTGGAKFEDFIALIEHIKGVVFDKFNILLEEEVRIING